MANLPRRASAILLSVLFAYSNAVLSGQPPGGATAAVDWAPRHEVGLKNSGLLFTTLDGDLHGFNEDGSRAWRVPLGEAFIRASAGDALSTEFLHTPRLLPALDGGLFLAKGDRISYVPSTVRDMVNMSPFKVNAFPGVYITGDRQSRARMIKFPLEGSSLKDKVMTAGDNESYQSDVQGGHDSDGVLAEDRHDHRRKNDAKPDIEGAGHHVENATHHAGFSRNLLQEDHHVKWTEPEGDHSKKLRVGMTRWRIAAVDDGTDQEQWSLTFNEISSVTPRATPSEMFLSWQDRVDIQGRSAILRPAQGDSTCSEEEADTSCELEGCLARPSREAAEQKITFDSEIVAAYVFTIAGDENSTLGLEAVAHPQPHLAPLLPGATDFPHLFLPRGSSEAVVRTPWYARPRLYEPLHADDARSLSSIQRLVPRPQTRKQARQALSNFFASRYLQNRQLPYQGELPVWLNSSPVRDELPRDTMESQGSNHWMLAIGIFALGMVFSKVASRKRLPPSLRLWGMALFERLGLSGLLDSSAAGEVSEVPSSELDGFQKEDSSHIRHPHEVSDAFVVPDGSDQPGVRRIDSDMDAVEPVSPQTPKSTKFSLSMTNSHFTTTFKDPKLIGVGGFGAVYEAEHQLEGELYAVKFIPINGLGDDEDVRLRWELCEVLNLRRLADTRHVVRYFTCWYEEPQYLPFFVADVRSGAASPTVASPILAPTSDPDPFEPVVDKSDGTEELSSRFRQPCPREGQDESLSDSCVISSLESNTGDVLFERDSQVTVAPETVELEKPVRRASRERAMSPAAVLDKDARGHKAVLLIQMELCRGSTLRSWLDASGRQSELPLCFTYGRDGKAMELAFARQLMKGIRQIHEMDVVHRDLKPQNIFITQEDVLKIGDFGLSRHVKDRHKKDEGEVGTALYCAPEGGARATKSADIFSAALIILELLCPPFKTFMERAEVLGAFRDRGELPTHIDEHLAEHAKLLRAMACRDPVARPSAQKVHQMLKQMNSQTKLEPINEVVKFDG